MKLSTSLAWAGIAWSITFFAVVIAWVFFRAPKFAAASEAEGVSVRPYGDEGVRITVGEPEATDVVLRVAGSFPR